MSNPTRTLRYWCAGIILSALAFLAADSVARMRTVRAVTGFRFASTVDPVPDSGTASGYAGNQHQVVVPFLDGYHWLLQSQQMLAGAGARVREVDYDGPPDGRAVHWSSSLRWALVVPAWIDSKLSHRTVRESAERVFPWINILCLLVLIAFFVPFGVRRLGWPATSLIVLGLVTVYPLYEGFIVGNFDHHGLAAAFAMFTVLLLVAGGGGWVRADAAPRKGVSAVDVTVGEWLLEPASARPWFIASGIAGAAGLWISAATAVPVLIGIGIGAFVSTAVLGRVADDKRAMWCVEPSLWRVWGISGAVASVCFYAMEYFPSHMGFRLEVNHPLYALALYGAGDFLTRFASPVRSRATRMWMTVDALMIVALPAIIVLVPSTFVIRPGTLLLNLHEDYITEFQGLLAQITQSTWTQNLSNFGLLPVAAATAVLALSFTRTLARPLRALAIIALTPAVLFTAMSFRQVRWFGTASALWLAALVVVVVVTSLTRPAPRVPARLAIGAVFALVFLPFPVTAVRQWTSNGWMYATKVTDLWQLATRDAAQFLRAKAGAERGMIVAAPTTSTLMTYFGGFRSLGTLYWENERGLNETAALLGATASATISAADSAHKVAVANGVTHLVFFSWNPFAVEYARLARGLRAPGPSGTDDPSLNETFVLQLLNEGKVPPWLRPVPYQLPSFPALQQDWVRVFEVIR